MNIVIRVDASTMIGTGHVRRCLVLASDLRKKGAYVSFICRSLPGDLMNDIRDAGFPVTGLPVIRDFPQNWQEADALQTIQVIQSQSAIDWLIIDHYDIDRNWESQIRPWVKKIMVIDDLANRIHDCDCLLDQNLYQNRTNRYDGLIPDGAMTLLGPKYLLLRNEFRDIDNLRDRKGNINRMLVSFGGSDPTNETEKAVSAIKQMERTDIAIDVVVGDSNEKYENIKRFCESAPYINLHHRINYVASLMAEADLAVGAGGSTAWERCFLGLPAITIEIAVNQAGILNQLSQLGAIHHLGPSTDVTTGDIADAVKKLSEQPLLVRKMANTAKSILQDYHDGSVVEQLLGGK